MRYFIFALAATIVTSACVRETPDPDMAAASATTETTATNVSTISPTTTGITGGSVTTMEPADREFVMQAAFAGSAEVAKSLLAVGKTTNADVREFAERMVTEHGRSNEELQKLATAKGLALPTGLDQQHQEAVDRLQDTPAPQFGREYIAQMVSDHEKAVAMLESGERTVRDTDVQAWVSRTLPVIRQHLQDARALQAKVR